MNITEAVRIALQSLWVNKLRSALTLLGVVIAVSALIAVVTFVNGINRYVAEKIFNLGADVFIISKSSNVITNVDQFLDAQKRKDLTLEDYYAVSEGCTKCKVVAASVSRFNGRVKYDERDSADTSIRGWTPSMAQAYDQEIVAGRGLTQYDLENNSAVAIVGNDILENLMPGVDPLGKEIRIDGWSYRVIGVGKKEGKTLGQSRDNYVVVPVTAWFKQYGAQNSIRILGKSHGVGDPMEAAIDQARVIMRARRHVHPADDDNFAIETNNNFLSIWANLSGTFFIVMIALSSISLVVGGIVIMNIMLVSVTERTREIGIRKAMGARRADVLRQFLLEAITVASVGGIIGVLAGIGIAKTVTLLIGMPSSIAAWAVGSGLLLAASVGVFFGVYPASRAAKLDPITALRFEL